MNIETKIMLGFSLILLGFKTYADDKLPQAYEQARKEAKEVKLKGPDDPIEPKLIAQQRPDLNTMRVQDQIRQTEINRANRVANETRSQDSINKAIDQRIDTSRIVDTSRLFERITKDTISAQIKPDISRAVLPPGKETASYDEAYDKFINVLSYEYVWYRSREIGAHVIPKDYDYGPNWRTLSVQTRAKLEPYFNTAYQKVIK